MATRGAATLSPTNSGPNCRNRQLAPRVAVLRQVGSAKCSRPYDIACFFPT